MCSPPVSRSSSAASSSYTSFSFSSSTSSSHTPSRLNQRPLAHLSPNDRELFEAFGLGPSRSVSHRLVHHAFAAHARKQPEAVAVQHHSQSISYGELDNVSNHLACLLRQKHRVQPGHRVCVLARRSIAYVVAVLAVLKAGAQYVPCDAPTITDITLSHILTDAAPTVVLVMDDFCHRLTSTTIPVMIIEHAIEAPPADLSRHSPLNDMNDPQGLDGCYVIYTSGTTGVPKGVDVVHIGVTNVLASPEGSLGLGPGVRCGSILNIAFDMGAWEVLGSLYSGATLVLRGDTSADWAALFASVHVLIATPSILTRHNPKDYPLLREVIVGGEVCPKALADTWASARPTLHFNNCCGPTEISVMNTAGRHIPSPSPSPSSFDKVSIGVPVQNTNVYLLVPVDEDEKDGGDVEDGWRAAAIGEAGTMWVGGVGVSRGYLNLPKTNAERWRRDPFLDTGAMMFNTGDLARWRPDGRLDHLGRADDQVKVKGFRVELDGVGAAMRTHPHVRNAVALLIGTELWGLITPVMDLIDTEDVRKATAALQPYYAVPTRWLVLPSLPMTSRGKVDKRALRTLAMDHVARNGVKSGSVVACTSSSTRVDNVSQVHRRPIVTNELPCAPTSAPVTPPHEKDGNQLIVASSLTSSSPASLTSPESSLIMNYRFPTKARISQGWQLWALVLISCALAFSFLPWTF